MFGAKPGKPKPLKPTPEAIAQFQEKLKKERELSAYAPAMSRVKTLANQALVTPTGTIEASPISGLAVATGPSRSDPISSTQPSWYRMREEMNERAVQPSAIKLTSVEDLQRQMENVYPPIVPALTQQQQLLRKRVDVFENTSSLAVASGEVTRAVGAEAFGLMGTALSYVVPKVILDAPRQIIPALQDAAESVGLDLPENFDTTLLDSTGAASLLAVEKQPELAGVAIGARRLICVLKGLRFNKAAAAAHLRVVYSILAAFAKPKVGVIAVAGALSGSGSASRKLYDPALRPSIAKMEESLHSGESFLLKFCGELIQPLPTVSALPASASVAAGNGVQEVPNASSSSIPTTLYTIPSQPTSPSASVANFKPTSSTSTALVGQTFVCDPLTMLLMPESTLEEQLKSFHKRLIQSVDDFLVELGLSLGHYDISVAYPQFKLFVGLNSLLRDATERDIYRVANRSGSLEELNALGGVVGAKNRVAATLAHIRDRLISIPHDCIQSPLMRLWWLRNFQSRQRISSTDLITFVFIEAGGQSNISTDRLVKLEPDLTNAVAMIDKEHDGSISLAEFSRFFYPADRREAKFFKVVEVAVQCKLASKIKLLPALPDHIAEIDGVYRIAWNNQQEVVMGRVIHDNLGWTKISGARGSGKSTRVLSVLHCMPDERDVAYIDLSTCRTAEDIISAIASQLLLRNCKSQKDFIAHFRNFLAKSVRLHATIVFDNLELEDLTALESKTLVREFDIIRTTCAPFASKHHFVLVSSTFPKTKAVKEYIVPQLSEAKSMTLAKELLPVDPISLMTAGRRLAGDMSRLARQCSLTTIRKLAAIYTVDETAVDVGKRCTIEGIEGDMPADQALAAACMLTGLAHFTEGHAWALCQDAFQHDILRWRIAWQGLVDLGWILYSQGLGFWTPSQSIISKPQIVSWSPITADTQVRAYIFYWAQELVRISCYSYESSCSALMYDRFRQHLACVLSHFCPPMGSKWLVGKAPLDTGSRLLSSSKDDMLRLAVTLAGGLERILTARYAPAMGVAITQSIQDALAASDSGEGAKLHVALASRDYCSQLLRAKNVPAAEKIRGLIASRMLDPLTPSHEKGTFSIVLANLHLASHRVREAKVALAEASRFLEADAIKENPWDFTVGTLAFVNRLLTTMENKARETLKSSHYNRVGSSKNRLGAAVSNKSANTPAALSATRGQCSIM